MENKNDFVLRCREELLDMLFVDIALQYSSGTEIKDLTVAEFDTLCNFVTEILKNPTKYIR